MLNAAVPVLVFVVCLALVTIPARLMRLEHNRRVRDDWAGCLQRANVALPSGGVDLDAPPPAGWLV